MPIGIINKDDYEKEVGTNNNGANDIAIPARSEIIQKVPLGRNGKPETPAPIRAMIAQESFLGVSSDLLAKEFNVSKSSVSAYKHDAVSTKTYHNGNDKLKKANNIFRDRIIRKASRVSLAAVDAITEDDLRNASLRDKSAVAREMASVVRDMAPDNTDHDAADNRVQIIIHAPQIRNEHDYIDGIVSLD